MTDDSTLATVTAERDNLRQKVIELEAKISPPPRFEARFPLGPLTADEAARRIGFSGNKSRFFASPTDNGKVYVHSCNSNERAVIRIIGESFSFEKPNNLSASTMCAIMDALR